MCSITIAPIWSIIFGTTFGVVAFSMMSGQMWPYFLVGGLISMAFLGPLAIWPVYRILETRHQLRIWWAVLIGAVIACIPDLAITLLGLGSAESLYVHRAQLVENGQLTPAGWYHFFIRRPLYFAPYGALGGLVAWLLAFGFRWKPPRDAGERD